MRSCLTFDLVKYHFQRLNILVLQMHSALSVNLGLKKNSYDNNEKKGKETRTHS